MTEKNLSKLESIRDDLESAKTWGDVERVTAALNDLLDQLN